MAKIEKHEAGSFSWFELGTTDQTAAKSFYQSLFGWSVMDSPISEGEFYSMFQLDGSFAGAAYTIKKEQRAQGVPPHWMVYITVDNADQTAAKVLPAGGTVLEPPFDVMDFGRMAVLQDPTGTVFAIWQPKKHSGTTVGGIDGTFCWADLSSPDPERAGKFYSQVFGWNLTLDPKDPSGYLHIKNGEHFIGGIPPAKHRAPNTPPHWLSYVQVGDVDATANRARQLGGKILMPSTKMENVGTWSIISDPQGAVFAIFKSAR